MPLFYNNTSGTTKQYYLFVDGYSQGFAGGFVMSGYNGGSGVEITIRIPLDGR